MPGRRSSKSTKSNRFNTIFRVNIYIFILYGKKLHTILHNARFTDVKCSAAIIITQRAVDREMVVLDL